MNPGASSTTDLLEIKVQGPAGGEAKVAFTADALKYILFFFIHIAAVAAHHFV